MIKIFNKWVPDHRCEKRPAYDNDIIRVDIFKDIGDQRWTLLVKTLGTSGSAEIFIDYCPFCGNKLE
jgi:hypothetical protein